MTRGEPDGLRVPAVGAIEHRAGGVVVVQLAGELDLYNAADVAAALREIGTDSPTRVVIDLSGVSFVDSTALGTLVQARAQLGDGTLVLAAPGPEVRRALDVSGLASHFSVHESADEALSSAG